MKDYEEMSRWMENNDSLAQHFARKFYGEGVPHEDLLQAARMGLWEGLLRWDPDIASNSSRSSYCSYWARCRVAEEYYRNHAPVHDAVSRRGKNMVAITRYEGHKQEDKDSVIASAIGSTTQDHPDHVLEKVVGDAVGTLPRRLENAIRLRFWGGHTYKEIARASGISKSGASHRVSMAIKEIREGEHGEAIEGLRYP